MSLSSNDVLYTAPYPGAVARTLTARLAEYVTPEDFGAAGDGVTDDTVALQAALASGRDVALSGKYLVSATLHLRTRCQRIFGTMGPSVTARPAITTAATSTGVSPVVHVHSDSVCLENLIIIGRTEAEADSVLILAKEDCLVTPDGENNADVDLRIAGCTLAKAQTLVHIKGRGLNITQCNMVLFIDAVVLDWPDPQDAPYADPLNPAQFNPGKNVDQALGSGMRAYMIRDNRFHAGSGGFLLRNMGWNASRIHGIQFSGNYIDTNCRVFEGYANESLFTDNLLMHSGATFQLFSINGGDSIRIGGNVFYGMTDNATGTGASTPGDTRQIMSGIVMKNVSNVSVDGNHFKYVRRDILTCHENCRNIVFRGNVMKDVCTDNDVETTDPYVGAVRHIVRINQPVDGVIVTDNVVDIPVMLREGMLIGLPTGTAAVTNLVVRDNLLPAHMESHNLSAAWRQAVADTSRDVTSYDGDGGASKVLTLRFAPVFVSVTIATGPGRGRLMAVSVHSSAGADLVQISGRDVIVRDAWNASGTTYTLHAFT